MESGLLYSSHATGMRGGASSEGAEASVFGASDLDLPGLLARVNGNRTLGFDLLRVFCAEYRHSGVRIEQLVSRQAYDEARNFLHGIKGTAANLGLPGVCNAAANYERALKLHPRHHPELQRAFDERLDRTFEAIRRIAGECSGELAYSPRAAIQSWEPLAPLIDEARRHLRQGNVRGAELVRQVLAQVRWTAPEICAELDRCVENYDFGEAVGMLDRLAKRIGFPRE